MDNLNLILNKGYSIADIVQQLITSNEGNTFFANANFMTFSIYALLGEGAPTITNESLALDLNHFFRNEEGFSLQFEQLPFAKNKTLALRWGAWLVRVCYEEGANVLQDSIEINAIVGLIAPNDLSGINKRIRVVYGDDDAQEYTNQIIYLMDFLREIPGVVIFDPQQKDLIKETLI